MYFTAYQMLAEENANRKVHNDKLQAALSVMVLDEKISSYLAENDPMALKQAVEALEYK